MAHVRRDCAQAQVDVDEGGLMTLEPARLDGNSAASDRPFRSISGCRHTSARIHPLHAVGEDDRAINFSLPQTV